MCNSFHFVPLYIVKVGRGWGTFQLNLRIGRILNYRHLSGLLRRDKDKFDAYHHWVLTDEEKWIYKNGDYSTQQYLVDRGPY